MDLTNGHTKKSIYLEPRSLLILKGDARYKWRHGIASRKNDNRLLSKLTNIEIDEKDLV